MRDDYALLFRFLPLNGEFRTSDDNDSIDVIVLARIYSALAATHNLCTFVTLTL